MLILRALEKAEFEKVSVEIKQKGPFNWTEPGEMLVLGTVCDGTDEQRYTCGCGRAFTGAKTSKSTTLGRVAEIDDLVAFQEFQAGRFCQSRSTIGMTVGLMFAEVQDLGNALAGSGAKPGDLVTISSRPDNYTLTIYKE